MPNRSRKRAREHAAASRRADDREFLEGKIDGARRHSLAEHDIDPEVFHHRVDEFLDRARQPMDLVDKEDRAFGGVGQEGHDVHLLVEGRAARDVELDAQLVVQDGREGRLAEAGGPVEKNVGQRLAPFLGGGQADLQPLGDGSLADDLAKALGPQLLVDRLGCPARVVRALAGTDRAGFLSGSPLEFPLIVGSRIDPSFVCLDIDSPLLLSPVYPSLFSLINSFSLFSPI